MATRRDVRCDVVVIGAGAAGMMCAATAGLRGRKVVLIEHYPILGEKIRISGGGRCNFTNVNAGPANFLSQNPDFCKSALARYTPRDFVALVERYGIAYHEKKLGQLFCDDTARDMIAMLKAECDRGRVAWRMPCPVDDVTREGAAWRVATPRGRCGPNPWSSRPAASRFLRSGRRRSGIALPSSSVLPSLRRACAGAAGAAAGRAGALRRSRGRRGRRRGQRATTALSREPAVHASRAFGPGDTADLILLERQVAARPSTCCRVSTPENFLAASERRRRGSTPSLRDGCRSASRKRGAPPTKLAADEAVRGKRLRDIAALLQNWTLLPSGTLGYNKAEVTLGGVDTRGLSSKSMAATNVRAFISSAKSSM